MFFRAFVGEWMIIKCTRGGIIDIFVTLPFSRLHLMARGEKDTGADERGGTPTSGIPICIFGLLPNQRWIRGFKLAWVARTETECMTLFMILCLTMHAKLTIKQMFLFSRLFKQRSGISKLHQVAGLSSQRSCCHDFGPWPHLSYSFVIIVKAMRVPLKRQQRCHGESKQYYS